MTDASPTLAAPAGRLTLARWLIVGAAVLWSTSGFFAKSPIFADWPGLSLAFWQAVFACLVVLPLVRQPRWSIWLVPMTLAFAAMSFTYMTAMVKTTAANAIWLQSTAPMWVFLFGVFFMKEPFDRRDVLLLVFIGAGVGLILAFESQGQAIEGVLYGLGSGVLYSIVVLCIRHLRDQDSAWLAALNQLVTVIALAPVALGGIDGSAPLWPRGIQWPLIIAFGMFQLGVPYVLFTRGLRSVPGHEAAGLALLEPVLVPVWVWVAWRHHESYEGPAWWTILGGALILTGLSLRYLRPRPTVIETAPVSP